MIHSVSSSWDHIIHTKHVIGPDESKPLTLKCCSGVPNPFDIGRVSLFIHSYTALQSSSDVLNWIFFLLSWSLNSMAWHPNKLMKLRGDKMKSSNKFSFCVFFKGILCALGNVSSWGKCELTRTSCYAAKTNINELELLTLMYTLLLAVKMVRGCKKCYHLKKVFYFESFIHF